MGFSFRPFSNSLNMKRTELSFSLNSLKHQIVTNLLIMTRLSFTFARLVKTSHSDGFTQRVELYNKHLLSSSSLIKINRYWSTMTGENGKRSKPLLVVGCSWTWHFHFITVIIWVGLSAWWLSYCWSIITSITLFWVNAANSFECHRHVQENSFS